MIASSPRTEVSNAAPVAGRDPASSTPVVLVVDDHEDTRVLLRYVMERKGRRVVEAANGEQAITLAQMLVPHIILMDAGMPGLDGLSAARRIRELGSLREVPIVFLSGHVQPAFRAKAFEFGGNEFLNKPVSIDELEIVVAKYLKAGMQQ